MVYAEGYVENVNSLAQLFDVGVPAISKHLNNIFAAGELRSTSTVSDAGNSSS